MFHSYRELWCIRKMGRLLQPAFFRAWTCRYTAAICNPLEVSGERRYISPKNPEPQRKDLSWHRLIWFIAGAASSRWHENNSGGRSHSRRFVQGLLSAPSSLSPQRTVTFLIVFFLCPSVFSHPLKWCVSPAHSPRKRERKNIAISNDPSKQQQLISNDLKWMLLEVARCKSVWKSFSQGPKDVVSNKDTAWETRNMEVPLPPWHPREALSPSIINQKGSAL